MTIRGPYAFASLHLVPYAEIARELGCAKETVRAIEQRALKRVRAAMSALGWDGSEIAFVQHALAGFIDGDRPMTHEQRKRRREHDRERWRRKKQRMMEAKR